MKRFLFKILSFCIHNITFKTVMSNETNIYLENLCSLKNFEILYEKPINQ